MSFPMRSITLRQAPWASLLALLLAVGGGCVEDRTSCTLVEDAEGATLRCDDGTSVAIPTTGPAGSSCTVEATEEGVAPAIVCDDGTRVEFPSGTSCTVESNPDGSARILCDDGTEAEVGRPTPPTDEPTLEVLAGVTSVGSNDGTATETRMDGALHAALSPDGRFLYFVDTFNQTIRRLGLVSGRVVTLAGSPGMEGVDDGVGAEARFEGPRGIAIDPAGQTLYIADGFNCTIRTLDLATLEVRTVIGVPRECAYVDGDFDGARLGLVIGMAMRDERYVYMAQRANGANAIRRIDLADQRVETIAGGAVRSHWDGPGAQAAFAGPGGIDFDETGGWLWVNDTFNNVVRRIDLEATRLAPLPYESAADSVVDAFDVAVAPVTLGPESVGVVDANGQPGVQVPVAGATILGGERDAQFWIGAVGDGSEADGQWTFGVSSAEGLTWETGRHAHVNMVLEWDGAGDGSTFGPALPTHPLALDLSGYAGVRVRFQHSSDPLELTLTVGARDVDDSPCGAACGFVAASSSAGPVAVRGLNPSPFEVFLPFDDLSAPLEDAGIPGVDLSHVTLLALRVASAPGTAGNDLALRSVSLVRWDDVEERHAFHVETVAGIPGAGGHVDGDGPDARFAISQGLTRGADGFYVAGFHDTVRRVAPEPPYTVTTVAGRAGQSGSVDGHPSEARFGVAFGVHAHPDGERIFYMDRGNNNIRELNLAVGRVKTIMGAPQPTGWRDGAGLAARFRFPTAVAIGLDGRFIYVADEVNHVVRRYDVWLRAVETLAGSPEQPGYADGVADAALFDEPAALALSADGRTLWIGEIGNRAIRALDTETLAVRTVAGGPSRRVDFDGDALAPGTTLEGSVEDVAWGWVTGLALDAARGRLYASDATLDRIRIVDLDAGTVATLAGGGAPPQVPMLDEEGAPVLDEHGDAVLVDASEYEVDGLGAEAIFVGPWGLALSEDGDALFVADRFHHLVRQVDTASGAVTTIAGEYGVPGAFDDVGLDAAFTRPTSVALSADARRLYVVDGGNHAVRRVDLPTRTVDTVVGELGISGGFGFHFTPLAIARLYFPLAVAVDGDDLVLSARHVLYRVHGGARVDP